MQSFFPLSEKNTSSEKRENKSTFFFLIWQYTLTFRNFFVLPISASKLERVMNAQSYLFSECGNDIRLAK